MTPTPADRRVSDERLCELSGSITLEPTRAEQAMLIAEVAEARETIARLERALSGLALATRQHLDDDTLMCSVCRAETERAERVLAATADLVPKEGTPNG